MFGKDFFQDQALSSDNLSIRKSKEVLSGFRFVGCASHRFNLDVKDVLKKYSDLDDVIHKIMTK